MRRLLSALAAFALLTAGFSGVAAAQDEIDGLHVTRTERQKLVLTWNGVAGAGSYEVLLDGTVAGEVDTNWFVASDLRSETIYDIQVRADNGAVSDIEAFSTSPERFRQLPTALRNLYPWAGARQIQFNNLGAPTKITRDGVVVTEAASGSFVDAGLSPETTYEYELQLVTGDEATDRFTRSYTIATVPLLGTVDGVTVSIIEPGIAQVSWDALPPQTNLSYRVYVNGELAWAPWFIDRKVTTRRIDVPAGETSLIQVSGFNRGGGPLSDAVAVDSPADDARSIGLEVTDTWAGTMVLRWDFIDALEAVFFDGVEVAEGRYGWARVTDLPYNETYEVSVVSRQGESSTYTLRSPTIALGDVQGLLVTEASTTSLTIDSRDFRGQMDRSFEIQRDGVVIGVIDPETPYPRTFVDTGLLEGTSYVYTVTEFAVGASGVATPSPITATTDGMAAGETPPSPEASVSFVDGSRAVIKVTTSTEDRSSQVHHLLEVHRNGVLIADLPVRPKWEEFTYFGDQTIDRSETTTYEVISVSSTGYRSAPTVIVVPALG